MSNNRIAQSENRIAQLTEQKQKNLRVMSTLLTQGKESSTEYKQLEAAVAEAESDISMIRAILNSPSFRAAAEKETQAVEQEARDKQNDVVVQQTASAVTAAIIKSERDERSKYNRAYRQFFKTGETRDILTSNSGAVIPQLFEAEWVETLKQISPVGQLVKRIETDQYGRPVKQPIVQDTANTLTYLPESTTVDELDPSLSSTLNTPSETDSLATMVRFSNELLSDAFDLVGFLKEVIGVR